MLKKLVARTVSVLKLILWHYCYFLIFFRNLIEYKLIIVKKKYLDARQILNTIIKIKNCRLEDFYTAEYNLNGKSVFFIKIPVTHW